MKLLLFQAERFRWEPFEKILDDAPEAAGEEGVEAAVVVFFHLERKDEGEEGRKRAFRHALKHVKWLARKRDLSKVVLHSFAHLGGDGGDPSFAQAFLEELAERLQGSGFEVALTPFGYTCRWDLAVYGETVAKVWHEV